MNGWTLAGIVLIALLPATVALVAIAAPAPSIPEPTGFAGGEANFSAWVKHLQAEGFTVQSTVGDSGLASEARDTSALIVVPQPRQAPSAALQDAWLQHLERGGSLLFMDGAGIINRFLSGFGAAVADRPLLDAGQDDPRIVRTTLEGHTGFVLAAIPSSLILEGGAGWQAVLQAGSQSYVDVDRNGQVDRHDLPGPHIVAAKLEHAKGGVIVVVASTTPFADRFVADNAAANREALTQIVADTIPHGGTVLIDESHHGWTSRESTFIPLVQVAALLGESLAWSLGILALIAAIASLLFLNARAVPPYRPHELAKTTAQAQDLSPDDGFFKDIAWQLLARQTGQDPQGPRQQVTGDDSLVGRALQGKLAPEDIDRLLHRYKTEVNHHA